MDCVCIPCISVSLTVFKWKDVYHSVVAPQLLQLLYQLCVRSLTPSQIHTEEACTDVSFAEQWSQPSHCAFLTSMSSTSRFPSGFNWFVNGTVHPFCSAYNVPLKNREKIISYIPFYPALCHSVHLGKCSTCMIRGILKGKATEFNISIFSFSYYSVLQRCALTVFCLTSLVTRILIPTKDIILQNVLQLTVSSKAYYSTEWINIHSLIIHPFLYWFYEVINLTTTQALSQESHNILITGITHSTPPHMPLRHWFRKTNDRLGTQIARKRV